MELMTQTILAFKAAFVNGTELIKPMAQGLFYGLMIIDLTLALARIILTDGNLFKLIVDKTVRYGLFYSFISNYDYYFHALINTLIRVGLTAAGDVMTPEQFADPSWLITAGFEAVKPVKMILFKSVVGGSVFGMVGVLLVVSVMYFLILGAYAIMAIQIFLTYLEVYIVGTLALYFLACSACKHTAFLAEKAIGAILSFGMKLMTMAFIVSVARPVLLNLPALKAEGMDLIDVGLGMTVTLLMIAFLCWQAPSLAAGLMAGSPSLSAGGLAGSVMAAGAGAMAGFMGAKGAANLATNLAGKSMGVIADALGTNGSDSSSGSGGGQSGGMASIMQSSAGMSAGGGGGDSGGEGGASFGSQMDAGAIANGVSGHKSAGAAAPAVGPSLGSKMDAASIAAGIQPSMASGGSSTAGSGESYQASSVGSNDIGSSEAAASVDSTSDIHPGRQDSARNLVGYGALLSRAIPPEAAPTGGVTVPPDKEE